MTRAPLAAVVGLFATVAAVSALGKAPNMSAKKQRQHAYTVALDCYATYRYGNEPDKAQQSYQAIRAVGLMLGKPAGMIAENIASADAMTRGDFSRDPTAYARFRSECVKVGL